MPTRRSQRPCPVGGCPELQPCPVHTLKVRAPQERLYSGRGNWRVMSKRYLMGHPFCVVCRRAASVVDHIMPHGGHWDRFWDQSNWQPLCTSCHGRKSARERRGFGRA